MALIFSLSAECGEEDAEAARFLEYFTGRDITVDGKKQRLDAALFADAEENNWVRVVPAGLGGSGPVSDESAAAMTAAGHALLELLKDAPDFRFAFVGVEVDELLTYSLLKRELVDMDIRGVVLNNAMWENIGKPDVFVSFRAGYVWRPYEGEEYDGH